MSRNPRSPDGAPGPQPRIGHWLLCLWPGGPTAWRCGDWKSVTVAVGFSLLLNLALVSNLVWPELFGRSPRVLLAVAALLTWFIAAGTAVWRMSDAESGGGIDDRGLFVKAISEYLGGRWQKAEAALLRLIRDNPHDIEAQLMLATLYRHTRRLALANKRLGELTLLEAASAWSFEIERERAAVQAALASPDPTPLARVEEERVTGPRHEPPADGSGKEETSSSSIQGKAA